MEKTFLWKPFRRFVSRLLIGWRNTRCRKPRRLQHSLCPKLSELLRAACARYFYDGNAWLHSNLRAGSDRPVSGMKIYSIHGEPSGNREPESVEIAKRRLAKTLANAQNWFNSAKRLR